MPLLSAINRCRLSNLGVYSIIKPDATSSEQVESQQDELEQINFENPIVESDHFELFTALEFWEQKNQIQIML